MLIKRFKIKNKTLQPWIKFIWLFEMENADIHQKLLPTDSIDIIINLGGDIVYENNNEIIQAPLIHINGLRQTNSIVHQVGKIKNVGISFKSYGLYPFINNSLKVIQNKIVNLHSLSPSLTKKLENAVKDKDISNTLELIEQALCSELVLSKDFLKKHHLVKAFMEVDEDSRISSFCLNNKISIKTLERLMYRYTGYSPKQLKNIKRFQIACNELIDQNHLNISSIAYKYNFADQAHFNNNFLRFTGSSPLSFIKKKDSVKQNVVYKYQ